eukprot:g1118.t1
MSQQVDVTSEGLSDLSRALTKKRLDYVKLTNSLNEPPRGVGDLITQSRDFTEKLKHLLEDGSEVSDQVRRELVDENGFPGAVEKLPLDSLYNDINRVKEELRIADGYQPYLVAPEAGLRSLFQRSIDGLQEPVRDLVERVHELVATAVDRALHDSCQVPPVERGPPVMRFPHFVDNVSPVALQSLETLKDEALKMALQVVDMEGSFVTCSFFRYLTFKRIRDNEETQKLNSAPGNGRQRRGRGTRTTQESDDDDDEDDEEDRDEAPVAESRTHRPRDDYEDILGQGLGAAIFWDPICRDQNNGLIPSPGIYIEGNDQDLSMDKALIQHAADMKTYTKLACETLIMTIPKVIVHCLVDKATEKLGPKIEEHILGLSPEVRELLLQEDDGIAHHREMINKTILSIGKAEETIKDAGRSMGESTEVKIPISIIELAGLTARLKKQEDGNYTFINKPPPPVPSRNRTPEGRDLTQTTSNQQRHSRPQRPAPNTQNVNRQVPAQLQVNGAGASGGGGSQRPVRRQAPTPPAVASAKPSPVTASANGQNSSSAQNQQTTGKNQQNKAPQGNTWYGFRPFNR